MLQLCDTGIKTILGFTEYEYYAIWNFNDNMDRTRHLNLERPATLRYDALQFYFSMVYVRKKLMKLQSM